MTVTPPHRDQRDEQHDPENDLGNVHGEEDSTANAQPQWDGNARSGEFQWSFNKGNPDDQTQPDRRDE